jgi:hypothetical protein
MNDRNPLADAIAITWKRNAEYGVRLVGDLKDEQFVAQPVAGRVMNHPAWVLNHLNLYAGIAVKLCRGEAFEDPADHPHGQKSEPLARLDEDPKVMVATWRTLHDEGTAALARATAALTGAPNPLARWRAMHPTVGDMLVTLMVKHESAHLGQLSAWRRAMGLPRVAM